VKFESDDAFDEFIGCDEHGNIGRNERADGGRSSLGEQHRFDRCRAGQQSPHDVLPLGDETISVARQLLVLEIAVGGEQRIIQGTDGDNG
jgi:hypothetical protein